MATLSLKIPDAQFIAGGRFDGQDKAKTAIVISLDAGGRFHSMSITNDPQSIEDFQFRPVSTGSKRSIYNLIDKGLLEITIGGTPQSPSDLSTLMATFYQDM